MKTNKLFITCLIVGLFTSFISCKKKDDNTPQNSSSATTGGQTEINFTGQFSCFKKVTLSNGIAVDNGYRNEAIVTKGNQTFYIGDISLNGTLFKFNYYYTDTTTSNVYPLPHNWVAGGTTSIPSFSYTNTTSFPTYTGYTALSDSFNLSNDLTIPLNGYNGADEIDVLLYGFDSNFNIFSLPQQTYSNTDTSIFFSSSELATLNTCTYVYLSLNFNKNNFQTINNQNHNFRTVLTVLSPIKFY